MGVRKNEMYRVMVLRSVPIYAIRHAKAAHLLLLFIQCYSALLFIEILLQQAEKVPFKIEAFRQTY